MIVLILNSTDISIVFPRLNLSLSMYKVKNLGTLEIGLLMEFADDLWSDSVSKVSIWLNLFSLYCQ